MSRRRTRFIAPVWCADARELDELTALLGWSDAIGEPVGVYLARVYGPRRRAVVEPGHRGPVELDYAQDTEADTQRDLAQCMLTYVRAIAKSRRDFSLIVPAVHSLRWEPAGPKLMIRVLLAALLRLAFPESAARDVEPIVKTSCFATFELHDLRVSSPETMRLLCSRWADPVTALTALINDTAFDLVWNWGCFTHVPPTSTPGDHPADASP